MRQSIISAIVILLLFDSCTLIKTASKHRIIDEQLINSPILNAHHTGFSLYDPLDSAFIISFNDNKYFTPASNTKLFTFYAALKVLPNLLPSLEYFIQNDTLYFSGTADPSFLNPDITANTNAYNFLFNQKHELCYMQKPFLSKHLGIGWAWDDYNDDYSAEKSPFPIFGNVVHFRADATGRIVTSPPSLDALLETGDSINGYPYVVRAMADNSFTFYPSRKYSKFKTSVPFQFTESFFLKILSDTLNRTVFSKDLSPKYNNVKWNTLAGGSCDSVYKEMLQVSDNFIAEHLLLMCSSQLFDTLSTEKTINYITEKYLKDLPDKPQWVDGSGLSRMNLFTPRSIVKLLEKIYHEKSEAYIFDVFPAGGVSGTIKNWYKAPTPYVFAKTGTLSNNHCLSGFLVAKSGKTYIFSFMNNNFLCSISEVRTEMQKILWAIHENY